MKYRTSAGPWENLWETSKFLTDLWLGGSNPTALLIPSQQLQRDLDAVVAVHGAVLGLGTV